MAETYKATGGARIGIMNASYPFAKLWVTSDALDLAVTFLGKYHFTSDQVVSVERYMQIPFVASGVRITHVRADYPEKFIFWYLGSPATVLEGIRHSGFVPSGSASAIVRPKGIPVRWLTVILAVLAWNGLFLIDFNPWRERPSPPGPFILLAFFSLFVVAIGSLRSTRIQRMILKPGRDVAEIKAWSGLLATISGLMFVIFLIVWASGTLTTIYH